MFGDCLISWSHGTDLSAEMTMSLIMVTSHYDECLSHMISVYLSLKMRQDLAFWSQLNCNPSVNECCIMHLTWKHFNSSVAVINHLNTNYRVLFSCFTNNHIQLQILPNCKQSITNKSHDWTIKGQKSCACHSKETIGPSFPCPRPHLMQGPEYKMSDPWMCGSRACLIVHSHTGSVSNATPHLHWY